MKFIFCILTTLPLLRASVWHHHNEGWVPATGAVIKGPSYSEAIADAEAHAHSHASSSFTGYKYDLPTTIKVAVPDGSIYTGPPKSGVTVVGPSAAPTTVVGPSSAPVGIIGPAQAAATIIGPSAAPVEIIGPTQGGATIIGPSAAAATIVGPSAGAATIIGPSDGPARIIAPSAAPATIIGATAGPATIYQPASKNIVYSEPEPYRNYVNADASASAYAHAKAHASAYAPPISVSNPVFVKGYVDSGIKCPPGFIAIRPLPYAASSQMIISGASHPNSVGLSGPQEGAVVISGPSGTITTSGSSKWPANNYLPPVYRKW